MTLDFETTARDLKNALGDFLARQTRLHIQAGGAGSVPELSDLAPPELQVEYLGELSLSGLVALGYRQTAAGWEHPRGWRLIVAEEGSGWLAEQAALRALLLRDVGARAQYRRVFEARGRGDTALREAATALYAQQVGFAPAEAVAYLFAEIPNWMLAAGVALDLHLGRVTRQHEDLDVIVPLANSFC